jgi:hypothetical protein
MEYYLLCLTGVCNSRNRFEQCSVSSVHWVKDGTPRVEPGVVKVMPRETRPLYSPELIQQLQGELAIAVGTVYIL